MINYQYFISYNYRNYEGAGVGNIELRRENKIKCMDDVNEVSRMIEKYKDYVCNSVVIINFVEF